MNLIDGPRTKEDQAVAKQVIQDTIDYLNDVILPTLVATKGSAKGRVPKAKQEFFDKQLAWLVNDAPLIDKVIDKFNAIKKKLDNQYVAKDWDGFSKSIQALDKLIYTTDACIHDLKRRASPKRKYKVISPLFSVARSRLTYIIETKDVAEAVLKRSSMTDKQIAASEAASRRMKMHWA